MQRPLMVDLVLVGRLPDLEQTDGRVKPIEDGQRHGDVRDHGPRPDAEELEVRGPEGGMALDQRIDEPHGHVGHQQERDNLTARLAAVLLGAFAPTPARVQHEQGLQRGLQQAHDLGGQAIAG